MISKTIRLIGKVLLLGVIYLIAVNYFISNNSKEYLFSSSIELPKVKYGLFLGTSKYFKKGEENDFYNERINAALQLFKDKKIDKLIVSGTHERQKSNYSEPFSIQKDLIARGINDSLILMDYFGDRTILSIENFAKGYPNDSVIIISQKFHNERAVYLARKHGVNAGGYNANDVKLSSSYKVLIREIFAKGRAIFE